MDLLVAAAPTFFLNGWMAYCARITTLLIVLIFCLVLWSGVECLN